MDRFNTKQGFWFNLNEKEIIAKNNLAICYGYLYLFLLDLSQF